MLVEKVSYRVNWKQFKRGYSFFIPCLDVKKTRKELASMFRRLKYDVVMKAVIEENVKGLRIWRV